MPRPARRAPKRTHDRLAAEGGAEPMMVSGENKRELILAHAAARTKKPSDWGMGYGIAVAASFLIVLSGWWLTLDRSIALAPRSDGFLQAVSETGARLRDEGAPQAAKALDAIGAAGQAAVTPPPNNPSSTTTTETTNPYARP